MTESLVFKEAPRRLHSIDAIRALTMLLMIFVNDLAGVKGIPEWIDHAKQTEDAMGFADTIFPMFLFIVGLSIPLALARKMHKKESSQSIVFAIISRSFALIIMGFFQVNLEDYGQASILPEAVWGILITVAFFLIWLDYPSTMHNVKKYFLMGGGWLILLLMAFLYVGGDGNSMQPHWWGILGLIGWGYLVCALIYFFAKGKMPAIIIAFLVFAVMNILVHGKWLHINLLITKDGSTEFSIMAGVIVSLWYTRMAKKGFKRALWLWMFAAGCFAIAIGLLVRPYTDGISKIRATPAWILICIGISILVFELMIYLVDFKGKKDWFKLIWPAGTATLTCYLIPYLQVGFYKLVHFRYPGALNYGWGGFLRSWVVAFIVVMIGGFLEKRKLKLKV